MGILVATALLLITMATTVPGSTLENNIIKPISDTKSEIAVITSPVLSEQEAPPSHKPTPTPKKPTKYIVQKGDTLEKIAKTYYGDSGKWTVLWNDNSWIEDFRIIQAGWELSLRDTEPAQEELNKKLAIIYEEITNPSPTLTPEAQNGPLASSRAIGGAGSFEKVYKQAGARFGIPWEILYGLHMVETGLRDGPISNGSGPQGPLQFMPGTWAIYGIDGNGDGATDINNAVDAIYGAANYLATHGGVEQGLRSYGRVIEKVYSVARSRGWKD